jgi:dimethylhistidine N-methyltransferase
MTIGTASGPAPRIVLRDEAPATGDLRADVLRGLSLPARTLPCKYFYDAHGASLFERICELEAYYPTRTELGILHEHIGDISMQLGPECLIVEFGSGSGTKTRLLLEHLDDPIGYVPIDISRAQLIATARTLDRQFPRLEVLPVCADYTRALELPETARPARRTVVFFPGSTIGNFEPADAAKFLKRVATLVGENGAILIGVDRRKDPCRLELAYNDPEGVTAEFNLNLLSRINRELDADFDLARFAHSAIYNETAGRIEMRLISLEAQTVRIPDGRGSFRSFRLDAGEVIVTEHSYKYDVGGFSDLAGIAGLAISHQWTDPERLFSLFLMTRTLPARTPKPQAER